MLCNYDGVAEIASETPLPDTENGAVGQSTAYAREDHQHQQSAIYESASGANEKWQAQEEVNGNLAEGVNEALSDIPLAPEQTGAAITGKDTLNNAKVSVQVGSKNLFDYNSKNINGTTKIANGFRTTDYSCSEDPANNPYFKSGVSYTISYKSKTVGQGDNTTLFGKVAIYNFTKGKFLYLPIESGTTFTIPNEDNGDVIGYVLYGSNIVPVSENYAEITNIQLEIGEVATEYTPYVAEGTSVNVTACGGNLFDLNANPEVGTASVIARAEDSITIKQPDANGNWRFAGFLLPNTIVGKTITLSGTWTASGNNVACMRVLWFNDAGFGKGAASCETFVSGQSATGVVIPPPEDATKLCLCLYTNTEATGVTADDTVIFTNIQLEIGGEAMEYAQYESETYPATVGQSVEIVQYDKITNVFTDNAGVTVSAAFKQSTRYELDTKPVSLAGTYAERPTGIYPYVVLYTATDREGETYRLEANADGSVSANWVQINGIYQHNIVMSQATGPFFSVTIRSRDNYAYAFSRLIEWFNGKGLNVQGKDYSDVAGAFKNDSGELHIISHMRANGSGLQVSGVNVTTGNVADFTINEAATCVDTVITI